jgi:hypothetical protein
VIGDEADRPASCAGTSRMASAKPKPVADAMISSTIAAVFTD